MGNLCSGSPACDGGGGCVTNPLPNLAPVEMIEPSGVPAGSPLIRYGQGPTAEDDMEWYLECNSDDARGGLPGAPHACCDGIEFTRASQVANVQSWGIFPTGLTTDSLTFGGVGHNCDAFGGGPGYTYLGAIADLEGVSSPIVTWAYHLSAVAPGKDAAIYHDYEMVAACFTTYPSGNAATQIAGLTPPPARAANLADCGAHHIQTGDSGGPVFARVGGSWFLYGVAGAGELAPGALDWWLFPRLHNARASSGIGGSQ